MSDEFPAKTEIVSAFTRLRASHANKCCFDCGAANPTWATVTYGVFICIDCSAVHRGLGVHLSFVRSTQLDTKWTWLQLRAMQLGGNANATQFFRQHGCNTPDANQKYNSRAASLYRDKLHHLATQSIRLHGTSKLHIDAPVSPKGDEEDADFFEEHTMSPMGATLSGNASATSLQESAFIGAHHEEEDPDRPAPKVDHINDHNTLMTSHAKPIKTTKLMGAKKVKKTGFGTKMGAKVAGCEKASIDFDALEAKAEAVEKEREASTRLDLQPVEDEKEFDETKKLSQRLVMEDIDATRKKKEEQLMRSDPKKAAQAERLGIGFGAPAKAMHGVAHSIASGITEIQQEGVRAKPTSNRRDVDDYTGGYGSKRSGGGDEFYDAQDDWTVLSNEPTRSWADDSSKNNKSAPAKGEDDDFFGDWEEKDKTKATKPTSGYRSSPYESKAKTVHASGGSSYQSDEASKKYGNAKAISSDMYFGRQAEADPQTRVALSRFDGASSISSADFYGNGQSTGGGPSYASSAAQHMPDMQDVKDSMRTGATKVAGKISSMGSSLSNYVQVTLKKSTPRRSNYQEMQ